MTRRAAMRGVAAAAAAWTAGAAILAPPRARAEAAVMTPDVARRKAVAGELTLIDIRTPAEWRATGVPDAATPIDMRSPDFLERLAAASAERPGAPVALICARGARSTALQAALARRGIETINVVEGFLGGANGPGWTARDLPISKCSNC